MSNREPRVVLHQKFGRIHFIHIMSLEDGFILAAILFVFTILINLAILALNILIFLVVTAFTGSRGARIASISALVLIVLFVTLIAVTYHSPSESLQQTAINPPDVAATTNPTTSIAPVTNTNNSTPSGSSTTTHVSLDSTIPPPGMDTGIAVKAGDRIAITATGWAEYGTNPDGTCDGTPQVNPDGQRQYPNGGLSCPPRLDPYSIVQNAPIGELLAGVFPAGTNGTPNGGEYTAVGGNGNFMAQSSGHLYLLFNESTYNNNGGWTDNSGSYQVTVTITPA